MWTGIYAKYNGEGVRIVGSLRMRTAHKGDGTKYQVEAYEVLAPNGDRIIAEPRNLLAIFEPIHRFRIDLDKVEWRECHWQPKELKDEQGDVSDS